MKAKGWKEIPLGGLILEPGNSVAYETGGWRNQRPILDAEKCAHCMICWIYCPEAAIQVEEGKVIGIDLRYCKGCGVCATECPRQAIEMVEEAATEKGASR